MKGLMGMRICPNCKKLSRDDDFCSHCGAAVYADNEDFAGDDISCDSYSGHSHEKTTYTPPYSTLPVNPSPSPRAANENGKKTSGCAAAIIVFIILMFFLSEIDLSDFSWLDLFG